MRTVSKLVALATLVTFTSLSSNAQEPKDDVKLTADQVAAIKKWGDPSKVDEKEFKTTKVGQNKTVIAQLIAAKDTKSGTAIHLGGAEGTGYLGSKDDADIVAVRKGGYGLALVDQRKVLWVAYDTTEGFQAPEVLTPIRKTNNAGKLVGWGYAPSTPQAGYLVVMPPAKK